MLRARNTLSLQEQISPQFKTSPTSIIYSDDAEKINSHHDTYVDRWQLNVLIQKKRKKFVIDLETFWIHSLASITAINEGKNFFVLN